MGIRSFLLPAILVAALPGQVSLHSGISLQDMDPNCKPCTDFWRYVNGGWLDKNPIPARLSAWGPDFVLAEANRERMRTILEQAAADGGADPGSNQRKIGDLYASCMDTAAINTRGITPLQPDFEQISSIRSISELTTVLARFQRMPTPSHIPNNAVVIGPFRLSSGLDPKNPSRIIGRVVERDTPGRQQYIDLLVTRP